MALSTTTVDDHIFLYSLTLIWMEIGKFVNGFKI